MSSQPTDLPRRPSLAFIVLIWLCFLLSFRFLGRNYVGWLTSFCQIVLGSIFGWRYYRDRIDFISLKGWWLGLLLTIGVIALNFSVFTARWMPLNRLSPIHWAEVIFFFLCLVGYSEELWFRGIWFAHFPRRPVISVLVGSLFFGAAHILAGLMHGNIPTGVSLNMAIMAGFGGLLTAVARYRGASLLVLAAAHGLIDLTHFMLAPATGFRFNLAKTLAVNLPGYLVLLALLFWLPAKKQKANADVAKLPQPTPVEGESRTSNGR